MLRTALLVKIEWAGSGRLSQAQSELPERQIEPAGDAELWRRGAGHNPRHPVVAQPRGTAEDGKKISTLDLFRGSFVLLTGAPGACVD